ncbi:tyrosine-type recombinase/integrase [Sulfurimonas autotrophica]|uniref:Integrase family protein n=1 Tax=Sulfurimonas autotrophica (strain ATCC BAA-671 / DSM 16294 / JCM 11897 / OK10) TaxID=563040 RepID=E0URF9_SULAO|nr:site-specific integrase [Sulfurimonas autotrophica]ADN10045.1 integrase family protein [Sulfurimonas autotrophica DSM 16294]
MDAIEKKLAEAQDPAFYDREYGTIGFRERDGKLYIRGVLTFRGKTEKVNKSTGFDYLKKNINYVEKHDKQLLWDLSNLKAEYDLERLGDDEESKIPLLEDFYEEAFDKKLALNNISIDTIKEYKQKFNAYISPYFKGYRLNKIKTSDIDDWQIWVLKNFKRKTVKDIRSVLNIILVQAKQKEYIKVNPVVNAQKYNPVREDDDEIVYTDTEMTTILTSIDDYIDETTHKVWSRTRRQLKNMIYLSAGTGIRSGELVALTWADIDFVNKKIDITKTIRNGRVKGTKTYSGKRIIDMNDESFNLLVNQYELFEDVESDYVFLTQEKKNYKNPSMVSKGTWKSYLKYCKIPYRRFYNLRHTFATNLINKQKDSVGIVSVSSQLGHRNVSTTLNKYVKNKRQHEGKFTDVSAISEFLKKGA